MLGTVASMKKGKTRQMKRRKPLKADKKKAPKTSKPAARKAEFQPPDEVLPEDEQDAVFIVGAMINHIFIDVRSKDMVEVLAVAMNSEVLDAAGESRLDYYRFLVPSDNDVVVAFFKGKKITETGAYHNSLFEASLAIEGLHWGKDSNPNDLSKPINVLKHVKLQFLAEAMADLSEDHGFMQDTEGMKSLRTKVALPSQLNAGYEHPVGSKAVKIDDTSSDGSSILIEVQAKGWQECFDVPANNVEPWADA